MILERMLKMSDKLTNEDVIAFIKEQGVKSKNGVKAKDIYQHFQEKDYSQGQVSGILFRLKSTNKVSQPQKGFYQVLISENALQSLKIELEAIYKKYEKAELSELLAMEQTEMTNYVNTIKALKNLINTTE